MAERLPHRYVRQVLSISREWQAMSEITALAAEAEYYHQHAEPTPGKAHK